MSDLDVEGRVARNRDDRNQWHLDKRLNVGHLATTVALVIAAAGAWSAQNERITRIEAEVRAQNTAAIKEAAGIRDALTEVKSEIRQLRQLLVEQIRSTRPERQGGY